MRYVVKFEEHPVQNVQAHSLTHAIDTAIEQARISTEDPTPVTAYHVGEDVPPHRAKSEAAYQTTYQATHEDTGATLTMLVDLDFELDGDAHPRDVLNFLSDLREVFT